MSSNTFTVIDHDNDNRKEFDSRDAAEDAAETAREWSDNVEIIFPGEKSDTSSPVSCGICGDPVENPADAETDVTGQPVHTSCWEDSGTEPAGDGDTQPAEVVDETPDAPADATPDLAGGVGIDSDPLNVLPGWMKTQVSYSDRADSQTTVNKRGCQVIAEYLGLDMVDREAIKRAHETDFEYASFEITMAKPDGRLFTGVGTARADGEDQAETEGWKLDMMAETRAYKRAVKAATGGGIEAFAKERDGET